MVFRVPPSAPRTLPLAAVGCSVAMTVIRCSRCTCPTNPHRVRYNALTLGWRHPPFRRTAGPNNDATLLKRGATARDPMRELAVHGAVEPPANATRLPAGRRRGRPLFGCQSTRPRGRASRSSHDLGHVDPRHCPKAGQAGRDARPGTPPAAQGHAARAPAGRFPVRPARAGAVASVRAIVSGDVAQLPRQVTNRRSSTMHTVRLGLRDIQSGKDGHGSSPLRGPAITPCLLRCLDCPVAIALLGTLYVRCECHQELDCRANPIRWNVLKLAGFRHHAPPLPSWSARNVSFSYERVALLFELSAHN